LTAICRLKEDIFSVWCEGGWIPVYQQERGITTVSKFHLCLRPDW